ncbi:Type IV pilus assembly PilZ [Candidatus Sulfopaludibacter sp. SbA3]|nr:Type IV pilus assembly PilZ [Candidatus Sulfopaludibacter sp. SbA3]
MNIITQEQEPFFGGMPDRRGSSRFPVREEVRYKILQHSKAQPWIGNGQTLNIGSGGILFTTEEHLPVGRSIEISVNWPARLDGTCPLKFVATGRIVRSDAFKAAVRIERYQFKTRGTSTIGAGERIPPPITLRHGAL